MGFLPFTCFITLSFFPKNDFPYNYEIAFIEDY